ncbi:alkaline phosphatase PafA [Costertonia aggregata]|uniref:Alkaline phosphatase family protein n=1 Tax=Costertonia aggregata TaxID=343403 RepID=A0A7H9AR89_9FLAO|nr:alkaline phosphatase PafA [Costertonia aggregata]QLG45988.1 alkaline phosphatase family protein [Costertonia aggregata]
MINRKAFQLFTTLLLVFSLVTVNAQRKRKKQEESIPEIQLMAKPKLVVGIVVDQMRYDYLTRFWNHYGTGGFKRLISEGYNCKNNHFNYAPTSTGPGHASVYTGTTPAIHGIIGNNWYDKEQDKSVYCAGDSGYQSVGTESDAGQMSPHRMNVTTITDELRLHNQMRGKTIAIALKDRGAVLPGGHTANGAYWLHGGDEGKWISSTYYMGKLPKWVDDFNASGIIQSYKKPWVTIKDINTYVESGSDNNLFEGVFETETTPTFPHNTPNLLSKTSDFDIIKYTPYGNSLTADFAIAALEGESLGKDSITDFLAVSFSSTDYVGHKFGVNSKEIQDTYIRLDMDLERLLNTLDQHVGAGEYTVFLSADHGAIEVPAYLKSLKIPSGYLTSDDLKTKFNDFLNFTFGTADVVKNFSNSQFFLDHKIIKNLDIDLEEAQDKIAAELLNYDDVEKVYTAHQMWKNNYTNGIPYILQNGFNQKRSGDILITTKPGYINYAKTGSTHGSPQIYDTHVPLLFFGKGIKKGSTTKRTEIPDIAPTIASLLGVSFPNGTTGSVISEVLE